MDKRKLRDIGILLIWIVTVFVLASIATMFVVKKKETEVGRLADPCFGIIYHPHGFIILPSWCEPYPTWPEGWGFETHGNNEVAQDSRVEISGRLIARMLK